MGHPYNSPSSQRDHDSDRDVDSRRRGRQGVRTISRDDRDRDDGDFERDGEDGEREERSSRSGRGRRDDGRSQRDSGFELQGERDDDWETDRWDDDEEDQQVSCDDCVVTLKGKVDDRSSKRLAEECAEDVYGVQDVMNEIRVDKGFFEKLFGGGEDDQKGGTQTRSRAGRNA